MHKLTGKLIGYARVSTEDQELRVQIDALEKIGCWNIYKEHRSATRGKRPELELALLDLRPGDTLVVWKLDRFARNIRELFVLLDRVHAADAAFMSITERFDLTTAIGRAFMGMMGVFAQFEAELTAERTTAGIRALKERGFTNGPPPKLTDKQAARMLAKLKDPNYTKAQAGRDFGVSPVTVTNYIKRAEAALPKRKRRNDK